MSEPTPAAQPRPFEAILAAIEAKRYPEAVALAEAAVRETPERSEMRRKLI